MTRRYSLNNSDVVRLIKTDDELEEFTYRCVKDLRSSNAPYGIDEILLPCKEL